LKKNIKCETDVFGDLAEQDGINVSILMKPPVYVHHSMMRKPEYRILLPEVENL
jgi:hypothetical protein